MPTSTRAGVGAATSVTGAFVVSTTVALLFTLTTAGVGVDEETAEATGFMAVEAGGELTRTGSTGSDATVRGRTTVFVLVDVGSSEYFDPRSDASRSVTVLVSRSGVGVGEAGAVVGRVAVAVSGVGSEEAVVVGSEDSGSSSPDSVSVPSGSAEFAGLDSDVSAPVDVDELGDLADVESVDERSDGDGSATAIPGEEATATPTPSAMASDPTRPTCLAYPTAMPFANPSRRCGDI